MIHQISDLAFIFHYLSILPPVQGFHIDAGDFTLRYRFHIFISRVDRLEDIFHFPGFRVFTLGKLFQGVVITFVIDYQGS